MGQVLHCSATTAGCPSSEQHSEASLRALAGHHGVKPEDSRQMEKAQVDGRSPTGPKDPRSTSLSIEEEAVVVAFRRHTLLPLDDCLYAL